MLLCTLMPFRRNLQRHLLVVGMLIIGAGLVAASDTLHDSTEEIILWTEGMISQAPLLGMLIFVLLAVLSAMVAFFSSALLAPVAVYAWGQAACLALLWCGWFLGGIASFCIGRFLGRSESPRYPMPSPPFISGSRFWRGGVWFSSWWVSARSC